MKTDDEIRTEVRNHYSAIARGAGSTSCCGTVSRSEQLGYSKDDLAAIPTGADLGLGCGNPQAIAALRPGEVVIDLGAGGGLDAFLAGKAVGSSGRVIGVDGSADMVTLARANAAKHQTTNVEFRLGEIEHLPVADATADVIISNCVINLAPDKRAVYREAFRALRPGGRLAISDVVSLQPLPDAVAGSVAALCGCISGAAQVAELETILNEIGFSDVRVEVETASRDVIAEWAPGLGVEDYVSSARITATRPGGATRAAGATPSGDETRAADDKSAGAGCCVPTCCT
jgi:arsenite methyltransferase